MPLERLLEEADVLSLHCPLTPETHHLVGPRELESMKASAVTRFRSTSTAGVASLKFIAGMRLCPPASGFTSSPRSV